MLNWSRATCLLSFSSPLSLSLSLLASSASSAYLLGNDVELIGGHTKWDGIVRILYQKTWRLLCDSGTWTLNDAQVSNGDAVLHHITCTCTFYVDRIQSFLLFLSFSLLFPPLCFRSSVTSLVIQWVWLILQYRLILVLQYQVLVLILCGPPMCHALDGRGR